MYSFLHTYTAGFSWFESEKFSSGKFKWADPDYNCPSLRGNLSSSKQNNLWINIGILGTRILYMCCNILSNSRYSSLSFLMVTSLGLSLSFVRRAVRPEILIDWWKMNSAHDFFSVIAMEQFKLPADQNGLLMSYIGMRTKNFKRINPILISLLHQFRQTCSEFCSNY